MALSYLPASFGRMDSVPARAAIVQGDRTVLVEVDTPGYEQARDLLARCAEIEKSPEHVHTYRLSALALWNAAAQGIDIDEVIEGLRAISRFPVPDHVDHEVRDLLGRYGVCRLEEGAGDDGLLRLTVWRAACASAWRATARSRRCSRPARAGSRYAPPTAARSSARSSASATRWTIAPGCATASHPFASRGSNE